MGGQNFNFATILQKCRFLAPFFHFWTKIVRQQKDFGHFFDSPKFSGENCLTIPYPSATTALDAPGCAVLGRHQRSSCVQDWVEGKSCVGRNRSRARSRSRCASDLYRSETNNKLLVCPLSMRPQTQLNVLLLPAIAMTILFSASSLIFSSLIFVLAR